MLPAPVEHPLNGYAQALARRAEGRVAAVYLVGSPALGDFSARQSNIDLVVVSDPPLSAGEAASLKRDENHLGRSGRPAVVWHTGWAAIADGPQAAAPDAPESPLETPMTRALLAEDAVALAGPDWPVVAFDADELRRWCRRRLAAMAKFDGMMVLRRGVAPLVLEAARLAVGVDTGRVMSKTEAGNAAAAMVRPHFRRILNDSVGYRNGANTSMYWGPFERKYDARQVIVELVRVTD